MSHSGAEHKLSSNTLIPLLHTWQLPQGLVYAVIVAAVAAWSWDRWESGHSTAIATLAASAIMLVLELALSAASPWAARALFGLRAGFRTFASIERAAAVAPPEAARRDAAAGGAAASTSDAPCPRLQVTEQEFDELRQAYARMLREVEQLVALSRETRPTPSGGNIRERSWEAAAEAKPAGAAAERAHAVSPPSGPTTPMLTTDHRRSTASDVTFAILSVAAVTLFILFVVVLATA